MESVFLSTKQNQFSKIYKIVAASLLWNQNRSQLFQYFTEIFSYVQLISIIKSGFSISSLDNSSGLLPKLLQDIVKYFSMIDPAELPLDEDTTNIPWFLAVSVYFLLVICIFSFMCYKYFKSAKIPAFIHNIWTYCAQLHHNIIFWAINIFLISTFITNAYKSEGLNIVLFSSSILLIILNYMFAAFGSMFCYDPFLSNNAFASYSSTFQTLAFIYRAIIGPMLLFVSNTETRKWLLFFSSLIYTLWRQELLFFHMPYYQLSTFKIMSLLAGGSFALSLTTLVTGISIYYDSVNAYDMILIDVLAVVLMYKVTIIRINNVIYKYSSLPDKQTKSPRDIFKRMIASSFLPQSTQILLDSESDKVCNQQLLFIVGAMSPHAANECKTEGCICSYLCQNDKLKSRDKSLFSVNKVIRESKLILSVKLLEKGINSFRQNNKFKILMGYILLKRQEKFCATLLTLFSVNHKQQTSLHEEVLIFHLVQQLEKEINIFFQNAENDKGSLNMKKVVDFEKNSDLLFNLIKKNSQSYLQLWDSFCKSNIPLHEFFSYSIKVEKEATKIDKIWNEFFSSHRQLSLCTFLYATYLTTIRNLPTKAEKMMSKISIYQKRSNYILHRTRLDGGGDVIFHVSMAREKLGRTLYVSRNICREFGWSQNDLINQNIKMIQPSFMKEKHDQIMLNHIEKPRNQPDQMFLNSFLRRKDGYCVPVSINITIFPYVQNEPVYASMIHKNHLTQDFVIIGPEGSLEGFSQGVGESFDIPVDKKININDICPDFGFWSVKESNLTIDFKPSSELPKDTKQLNLTLSNYKVAKRSRKVSYQAKVEEKNVLDQRYTILYLFERKTTKKEGLFPSIKQLSKEELLASSPMKRTELSTQTNNDWHLVSEGSLLLHTHTTIKKEKYQTKKLLPVQPDEVSDAQAIEETFGDIEKLEQPEMIVIPEQTSDFYNNERALYAKANLAARSQAGSLSTKERVRLNEKLEQAIYVIPKEKYMKILNYLISIFTFLCAGLMCFHLIDSQSEFNLMLEKIELITAFQKTSFTIVNSDANIRQMDLYSQRYIMEDRRSNRTFSARDSQISVMGDVVNLNKYTRQILETFNNLDPDLQKSIFGDDILVKGRDSSGDHYANGIEVLTELSSALNAVSFLNAATFTKNQSDAKFILDNALNNPFLISERIVNALIEDCKRNLSRVETKTLTLLPIVAVGGLCVLVMLLVDVRLYLKKRDHFVEILLKIDQSILQKHLKLVDKLNYSLKSDTFDFSVYLDTKTSLGQFFRTTEAKIMTTQKFYKSKKRLNFSILKGIIFTIIAILGFFSAFVVLAIKFDLNLDIFLEKVDKMTKMYQLHTNFNLFNVAVLEYISENNSTYVKNKQIDTGLKELYNLTLTIPQFLQQVLVDNDAEDADPRLRALILGDACNILSVTGYTRAYCGSLTQSVGTKGLVTMSSFLIATYQESKRQFDISNRTSRDINNALNSRNRKSSQNLAPIFTEGTNMLKDILEEDLRQAIITYREEVILISAIYAMVYLIIGTFLSFNIWKKIEAERINWRKMMRHIPLLIIISNKSLKTFIIKNCNNMLDSFKMLI